MDACIRMLKHFIQRVLLVVKVPNNIVLHGDVPVYCKTLPSKIVPGHLRVYVQEAIVFLTQVSISEYMKLHITVD